LFEKEGISRLRALFKISEYQALFDEIIAPRGGLLAFLDSVNSSEFDVIMKRYREQVAVVADLMDYRFRYLDHGGTDKRLANLSHAYVYRFKKIEGGQTISGKTIRTRWTELKSKAIFIYVSEKTNSKFYPREIHKNEFLDGLTKEANDLEALMTYFGKCAYISDCFSGGRDEPMLNCFPPNDELPRIRPKTDELPEVTNPYINKASRCGIST
jgi:hypothetical protein